MSIATEDIQIVVNGEIRQAPAGRNLEQVLAWLEVDPERVAVELDRVIVRRPNWKQTPVQPGAVLEIVQFVGGG